VHPPHAGEASAFGAVALKPKTVGNRRTAVWYLLIHQLPPQPLYLRAKIRQQLSRVGAIPLKKAVYALPETPECLEDLQWIAQEATAGGGEAFLCRASFLERRTEEILRSRSRKERDADYQILLEELARPGGPTPAAGSAADSLAGARAKLQDIRKIDFFDASMRRAVERRIGELEKRTARKPKSTARLRRSDLAGKIWLTRPGVKVDRIASAWFVRRFIDSNARFRFEADSRPAGPREVSFDVVGGDFTHEGDRCTLETLLLRTGIRDGSVSEIAEIVHDIDLKDGKFGRLEAPGVEQILAGLLAGISADSQRLVEGFRIFDQLYRSFRKPSVSKKTKKPR
jgi:hypothetical protein